MSDDMTITLFDAAREHLKDLRGEDATAIQAEVERFVRWAGADRVLGQLTANEVANYAETFSGTMTDAGRRGDAVKKFLAFAKKAGYTSTNLGTHLRIKKRAKKAGTAQALDSIEMTESAKAAVVVELEALKAQRPRIIDDIRRAMADKDFKENAPLDAARDQQGYVEGRIRRLEATLDQVVIVEEGVKPKGDIVELGCTVVLRNLKSNQEVSYTLVRPAEADASQGKISLESPVGRSVLKKSAGDEVNVSAPSGNIRFRLERVET
ncbi:MAG: transcription elongation factor GreA [Chloroflexi bacterium]|nr:transcription elongation factor GreA [Chloroflexota bacterium]